MANYKGSALAKILPELMHGFTHEKQALGRMLGLGAEVVVGAKLLDGAVHGRVNHGHHAKGATP